MRGKSSTGKTQFLVLGIALGALFTVALQNYFTAFDYTKRESGGFHHEIRRQRVRVGIKTAGRNTGDEALKPDDGVSVLYNTAELSQPDSPLLGDFQMHLGAEVSSLLEQLDSMFRSVAKESNQVYEQISNSTGLEQPLAYLEALREYDGPAERICEIGFAGGHSATLFLHALPNAAYQGFDLWDRPLNKDAALAQVKAMFPTRQITVTKGDSTATVPQYEGTCDVIHIAGAQYAHIPATDLANMERLANAEGHLLLVDDCTTNFPAVLNAWKSLEAEGRVREHMRQVAEGLSSRGKREGWCIGEYARTKELFAAEEGQDGIEVRQLVEQLDLVAKSKALKQQIHEHNDNHTNLEQPLAYLEALRKYDGTADRICEIGFAGGHSATLFLHALPNAAYHGFDLWDRPLYKDAALAQVKASFPTRQITITKGDSTATVPKYEGTCDVIHINSEQYAQIPATDLANMERLANPEGHLLLVDECTTSSPEVLNAWKSLKADGRVREHKGQVAEGLNFLGKQTGWCIGEFAKPKDLIAPDNGGGGKWMGEEEHDIGSLLEQLGAVLRSMAGENQVNEYMNNSTGLEQPLSYLEVLREYDGPAERICEIGFAGGYSATIFLHALPNAAYHGFDLWDRPLYKDAALVQVKAMFPTRQITVTKGDSTATVPKYEGSCDVIHINGAQFAQIPATDLANMERLANPDGHLLIVSDCTTSFPAILNAWKKWAAEDRVRERKGQVTQGWCVGEYTSQSIVSQ